MKKFVSYIIGMLLAAGSLAPVFAFADNATSTPPYPGGVRGGMQKEMRTKMMGLRNDTATSTPMMRGQEMKKAQEEMRKRERDARLQTMIQKMVNRFKTAIERERKLADRIASRLDKAEQNGKDVAALRQKLTDAQLKIADARSALDTAEVKLQTAIASSTAKNIMKDVTHAFGDVTVKLKAAHAALVDVINLLKGIGNTATTTPQNP